MKMKAAAAPSAERQVGIAVGVGSLRKPRCARAPLSLGANAKLLLLHQIGFAALSVFGSAASGTSATATAAAPTYFEWRFVWSSKLSDRVGFTLPGFTTQQQNFELDGETVTAPTTVDNNGRYWEPSTYDDAVRICERAFNCEYILEFACANHFRENYGGAEAQAGDAVRILTPKDVRDTWETEEVDVKVRLGDHTQATKLDATPQTVSEGNSCYLQKQSIFRPIVLNNGIASDTELLNVAVLTNLATLTSDNSCKQVTHLSAALDVAEADGGRSIIYSPESCGDSGLGLEAAFDATQGAIVGLTKKDYDATGWYVCMNSVSSSLDIAGTGACVLRNAKGTAATAAAPTYFKWRFVWSSKADYVDFTLPGFTTQQQIELDGKTVTAPTTVNSAAGGHWEDSSYDDAVKICERAFNCEYILEWACANHFRANYGGEGAQAGDAARFLTRKEVRDTWETEEFSVKVRLGDHTQATKLDATPQTVSEGNSCYLQKQSIFRPIVLNNGIASDTELLNVAVLTNLATLTSDNSCKQVTHLSAALDVAEADGGRSIIYSPESCGDSGLGLEAAFDATQGAIVGLTKKDYDATGWYVCMNSVSSSLDIAGTGACVLRNAKGTAATAAAPTYFKWRFVWSSKADYVDFTLPGFTTQQQIELDGKTVTAPTTVNSAAGGHWEDSSYDDAVKICERAFNCEYILEWACANHFRANYGGEGAQAGDAARFLTRKEVRDTWETEEFSVKVRLGDHTQATKLDATPQTVSEGNSCYLQKQSIFRPIVLNNGIASDTELLNVAVLTNLATLTSDNSCKQVTHLSAALDVAEADGGRSIIYSPESCGDSGLGLEAAFDATQGAIVGLTKKDYDATGWYVCMNSVSSSLDIAGTGACVLRNTKGTATAAAPTYFKWRFVWSSKVSGYVDFALPGFTTQQQIELDGETVTAPTIVNTAAGRHWEASSYDDAAKICERAFNCEYILEWTCANHFRANYGGEGAQAGDAARFLTRKEVRDTWETEDAGVKVRLGDHTQATKLDATPQTVSEGNSCYLQKQSIFRPIVLNNGIASDTELLNVAVLTNLATLTSDNSCKQVTHLSAALDVAEADGGRSIIYSPESCGDSGLGLEAAFDATQGAIVGLTKKDYDATGWYVCMNSVSTSLDIAGTGACVLRNTRVLLGNLRQEQAKKVQKLAGFVADAVAYMVDNAVGGTTKIADADHMENAVANTTAAAIEAIYANL